MLTDYEKSCLTTYLQTLDDEKIKHLAGSVTNGMMRCYSREEATKCILQHCPSLAQFFHRKKADRNSVFRYLHQMNVAVHSDLSKEILIQMVFELWRIPYTPMTPASTVTSSFESRIPSVSNAIALQTNSNEPVNSIKNLLESEKILKEANTLGFEKYISVFAEQFYRLLNETPSGSGHLHSLNNTHFFGDCKMIIRIKGDSEETEVFCEGSTDILNNLSNLKKEHKLIFRPNLTEEGVRGKRDRYGTIQATVCGTLHQLPNRFVGYFQQAFVLGKDPFENDTSRITDSALVMTAKAAAPSLSQLMLESSPTSQPLAVGTTQSYLSITDTQSTLD